MCKSGASDQGPFLVDILDYRSRRKRTLEELAKKGAVAVLNGDSEKHALLPMSPYERRIVHQYLQENFADLASESEGEGQDRHIVISFRGLPADSHGDDESDEDYYADEVETDNVTGAKGAGSQSEKRS
jgi:spoIIIJ-associated protein